MELDAKIYVAGHRGLVGAALVRALQNAGYQNIVCRTSAELDLRDQAAVHAFFEQQRPDYVLVAAAKVGGIHANNTYPADFIYDNLIIEANVIHAAFASEVSKLLFLGSTCIYPKLAPQPIQEASLLAGPLEPTNEWYAVAKIAGIKLCQAYQRQYGRRFISAMPTNLYGPNDNFDLQTSHVLPALLRKFHEAKVAGEASVTVWGTGTPLREFIHVDDCASACLHLMQHYEDESIVNIGVGEDLSIGELAKLVGECVGFTGQIVFDATKPDGTPRKLVDVSKLTGMGWRPAIPLAQGVRETYQWYVNHLHSNK